MTIDLADFCARLFADQELIPRARTIAQAVSESLSGISVNIYILSSSADAEKTWIPKASAGETFMKASVVRVPAGDLAPLAHLDPNESWQVFPAQKLARESYSHLDIRKALGSLAYIPLIHGESVIGAIELLDFEPAPGQLTEENLAEIASITGIAASALAGASAYESERNHSLVAINRLTQLYDLEKIFSATLDLERLLPVMGAKFREVMECAAVNVWMLLPDETVELMHQSGADETVTLSSHQSPREGIAGALSDTGEPVLIEDSDDPRLTARNEGVAGGVFSLLAVPIMDGEALVGVVEAINKTDGHPFTDDDLFILTSITETASIALHNAGLVAAERKVEILETLVTVSHEITSTLNLERMLQTIVDAPQVVIPYERAALALKQGGRFKLRAVTGLTTVSSDAPEIAPLNQVLQWVAFSEEIVHVRQEGDQVLADREETRDKFRAYFQETGMRGFYAVPLADDTGAVGVLSLESSDPDFLLPVHIEILEVLAGQATVALRNAQMYKEVPFISVLEPVLERKRRFMALEKRRRAVTLSLGAIAVIFLALCPLPMRVDGSAVVAPVHRAQVQPEFEGVVGQVFVHEGQYVKRGDVVAELEAWDYRSALAEAQARYQATLLQVNRSLAANDGSEAGIQSVQADYWKSAVDRAEQQLERSRLRSPLDGVVATPHVENMVGRRLQPGETFAEVLDASTTVADVAMDDADTNLVRPGASAAVKLNSFPTKTFHGVVSIVSPKAERDADALVFFARVNLENNDGSLLSGMEGRGKVWVGWHPAGYVLFRRPALWIYSHLWSWFGW
jgi:RND family efflux transporter MFP subunit